MELSEITTEFVLDRYHALQDRWSDRNTRMDDYEALYRLDLWEGPPEPDERRITVPTCFDAVEDARALLLTKRPVISVPPSEVKAVAQERAEAIERYLWGVWDQAHVMQGLRDAEWCATCLGEGVLRCVYDTMACEDELPLLVQALDPRNVYAAPSGRPMEDLEVVHAWDRPRREIVAEWGECPGQPDGGQAREDWLDEAVPFVDYWRLDTVVVTEPTTDGMTTPTADGRTMAEGGAGPVERLVGAIRGALGMAGATTDDGERTTDDGREMTGEGDGLEDERLERRKVRKIRRRVVTNAVLVDEEWVKPPLRVPYPFLPFVRFAGIRTPLPNENGALSVLFPLTGGSRENGAVGVAAAEAEAVAFRQRLVEMAASPALLTDDPNLVESLDMSPGAVNAIQTGRDVKWLVAPGPNPAADAQIELLQSYVEAATLPDSMRGRSMGDASGLALTSLANVVMMRTAARQEERERACERLNALVLALTEEFAPTDGWEVWGTQRGTAFEAPLKPAEIGGYRRNVVKLSASLPKDEAGEVMSMASLVQQDLLSRESFLDHMQQVKRLASQSPEDEVKRILRDKLLFGGKTAERLAELVLSEFDPALARVLLEPTDEGRPQAPPGGMPPGGMPPMGPQGPMGGMPPGVVAPTPQMVGAGGAGGPSPESVAAMMSMQGQGAPAMGPLPRGPVPPVGRGGGL